ncbi:Resolvase/invertase-type recombinase catalytic domain-containing protein [Frankia sp. AiPs1]|uniref:recombinase family protein n=1 Tax=Frankia sp. AiPa1 TaxID=573492 RepID=UPI00202AD886|nr:recombinase family protein [Frankia sp. AiPa1]MCL9761009.1 recombinase family protein [Frankia sp. AiPa1]
MTAARPSAFGYIAVQHADETEIDEHLDQLTAYAEAEGFHLVEVYVDRRIIPGSLLRPALEVLITQLKQHEGARVLVPTPDHLSPAASVRTAILSHLHALGAAVVVTA